MTLIFWASRDLSIVTLVFILTYERVFAVKLTSIASDGELLFQIVISLELFRINVFEFGMIPERLLWLSKVLRVVDHASLTWAANVEDGHFLLEIKKLGHESLPISWQYFQTFKLFDQIFQFG